VTVLHLCTGLSFTVVCTELSITVLYRTVVEKWILYTRTLLYSFVHDCDTIPFYMSCTIVYRTAYYCSLQNCSGEFCILGYYCIVLLYITVILYFSTWLSITVVCRTAYSSSLQNCSGEFCKRFYYPGVRCCWTWMDRNNINK